MRETVRLGAVNACLLAVFAFGIAYLSILPPFEGMDETAHYSSIVQLADTGEIPVLGRAYMAREVEAYRRIGPTAYSSVAPFEANGGITYRDYFAGPAAPAAERPVQPFQPSETPNWQAQHPPLYYALLAPIAKLTDDMTLRGRLFWLRFASFAFAFAGLCVAVRANADLVPLGGVATAAWPLLFAEWFPEMVRLGNDSLALLLASISWWSVVAILRGKGTTAAWIVGGIAVGLGCLTKGYMVVAGGGALALLGLYAWRAHRMWPWFGAVGLATAIGAPWFVWRIVSGVPLTNDSVTLATHGGLLAGLVEHGSLFGFAKSLATIFRSFLWTGSWSFVFPPPVFYAPLAVFVAIVAWGWARALRAGEPRAFWPCAMFVPMLAGLMLHSLVWLAIDGSTGVTGGWYLHALTAPLSVCIALGIAGVSGRSYARRVVAGLAAYGVFFGVGMMVVQAQLFAGCVYKEGAINRINADHACLLDFPAVVDRIGHLAYPEIGIAMALAGAGALTVTAMAMFARHDPSARTNGL